MNSDQATFRDRLQRFWELAVGRTCDIVIDENYALVVLETCVKWNYSLLSLQSRLLLEVLLVCIDYCTCVTNR